MLMPYSQHGQTQKDIYNTWYKYIEYNFIIYYPNSIVLYLFIEIYFVHTIIEELYIESHFIQKLKFLRKS